jgi:hypothetical protein
MECSSQSFSHIFLVIFAPLWHNEFFICTIKVVVTLWWPFPVLTWFNAGSRLSIRSSWLDLDPFGRASNISRPFAVKKCFLTFLHEIDGRTVKSHCPEVYSQVPYEWVYSRVLWERNISLSLFVRFDPSKYSERTIADISNTDQETSSAPDPMDRFSL